MIKDSRSENRVAAIVGLDPGTTFGIAVLDLYMKPIYIKSFKSGNLEKFVRELSLKCKPVLFTCDVNEAPDAVKKMAAFFEANIFLPSRRLEVQEKQKIVNEYIKTRPYIKNLLDEHSSDALSSALKAFKNFKNRFERIDILFRTLASDELKTNVKAEVVKGYNIKKAFRKIFLDKSNEIDSEKNSKLIVSKEPNDELRTLRRKISDNQNIIKKLKKENMELSSIIKKTRIEKGHLSSTILKLKNDIYGTLNKDAIYTNQRKEIQSLRQRLDRAENKINSLTSMTGRLRKIKESGKAGGLILLKPIENFTKEGVDEAVNQMNIKNGDAIIILNAAGGGPSTAKKLLGLKPKFIVCCTGMSHEAEEVFIKNKIPMLQSNEIEIKHIDDIPAVLSNQINKKIKGLS